MPQQVTDFLNQAAQVAVPLAVCVAVYVFVMWISLILWTIRDIHSRTHDFWVQALSIILITVFSVFALPVYFILRPRETLGESYERQLEEEALLHDIEKRRECSTCHSPVEEDYLLCPSCHTRLKRQCTSCGRMLSLKWDVCPFCAS